MQCICCFVFHLIHSSQQRVGGWGEKLEGFHVSRRCLSIKRGTSASTPGCQPDFIHFLWAHFKKQLWGNCFPVRNTIWLQLFNSSLSTFHTLPQINTCFGNIHTWITCQNVLSLIHGLYHPGMNSLQCLGRTAKNIPLVAWFTSSTA